MKGILYYNLPLSCLELLNFIGGAVPQYVEFVSWVVTDTYVLVWIGLIARLCFEFHVSFFLFFSMYEQ